MMVRVGRAVGGAIGVVLAVVVGVAWGSEGGATVAAASVTATSAARMAGAEAQADPGRNAALDFWRASALLPNDDHPIWIPANRSRPVTLDATAAAVVDTFFTNPVPALDLLACGSRKPYCDWGVDPVGEGFAAPLPYLSRMRQLVRLLALRARWHAQRGDGAAAVDDLVTDLRAARLGCGEHPCLLEALVAFNTETTVIDAAGWVLPRLSPGERRRLISAASALPATTGVAPAWDQEAREGLADARALRALSMAERRRAPQVGLMWVADPDNASISGNAALLVDLAWAERHVSDAIIDDYLARYPAEVARWKAWFEQPPAARATPLAPLYSTGEAPANPMMADFGKYIPMLNGRELATRIRFRMLVAAGAYIDDGAAGLAAQGDPVSGKPFTLASLRQGFRLVSTAVPGQEKLTRLVIGEAGAEEMVDPPAKGGPAPDF
jgi:hypothetical protein